MELDAAQLIFFLHKSMNNYFILFKFIVNERTYISGGLGIPKREIPWDFGNFNTFFKNKIPNSQRDSQNPVGISMRNGVFLTNKPHC